MGGWEDGRGLLGGEGEYGLLPHAAEPAVEVAVETNSIVFCSEVDEVAVELVVQVQHKADVAFAALAETEKLFVEVGRDVLDRHVDIELRDHLLLHILQKLHI